MGNVCVCVFEIKIIDWLKTNKKARATAINRKHIANNDEVKQGRLSAEREQSSNKIKYNKLQLKGRHVYNWCVISSGVRHAHVWRADVINVAVLERDDRSWRGQSWFCLQQYGDTGRQPSTGLQSMRSAHAVVCSYASGSWSVVICCASRKDESETSWYKFGV